MDAATREPGPADRFWHGDPTTTHHRDHAVVWAIGKPPHLLTEARCNCDESNRKGTNNLGEKPINSRVYHLPYLFLTAPLQSDIIVLSQKGSAIRDSEKNMYGM
jgi:hypothetical protein